MLTFGQEILLKKDIWFRGDDYLKAGNTAIVKSVGIRYGLPFIFPEGSPHERQLQSDDYEVVKDQVK